VVISFAVKLPAPAYRTRAGQGHTPAKRLISVFSVGPLGSSDTIFSFVASALSLGNML
jgi:hypothetical protein